MYNRSRNRICLIESSKILLTMNTIRYLTLRKQSNTATFYESNETGTNQVKRCKYLLITLKHSNPISYNDESLD